MRASPRTYTRLYLFEWYLYRVVLYYLGYAAPVPSRRTSARGTGAQVAPPECGIFLVVADLNGSKDTIKMLACLNKCFPHGKVGDSRPQGAITVSRRALWEARRFECVVW